MAIINATGNIDAPRADQALSDRLDSLTQERAVFILQAMVLAGHVSPSTMTKAIDLADTISFG